MTPESVKLLRRLDERWSDYFGLYAVDGENRAVSQVLVLHVNTSTRAGKEKVAGIAGVGTLPAYSRKGLSTALMKAAHERIRHEGMRLSFLTTSSSLVAKDMYNKLGYSTMATFQGGFRKVIPARRRDGLELRRLRAKDAKVLDWVFSEQTSHALGFNCRQPKFLGMKLKTDPSLAKSISVASIGGRTVGYVRATVEGAGVNIEELIAVDDSAREGILAEVERKFKPKWDLCTSLCDYALAEFYTRKGFTVYGPGWGRVMVACVDGSMSSSDIAQLYGVEDKQFIMYPSDAF
jgi:predicted acetyltransferase